MNSTLPSTKCYSDNLLLPIEQLKTVNFALFSLPTLLLIVSLIFKGPTLSAKVWGQASKKPIHVLDSYEINSENKCLYAHKMQCPRFASTFQVERNAKLWWGRLSSTQESLSIASLQPLHILQRIFVFLYVLLCSWLGSQKINIRKWNSEIFLGLDLNKHIYFH